MTANEARNTANSFLKRKEENVLPGILKEIKLRADVGIKFLELEVAFYNLCYRKEDIDALREMGFGTEYRNEYTYCSRFLGFFGQQKCKNICVVTWY